MPVRGEAQEAREQIQVRSIVEGEANRGLAGRGEVDLFDADKAQGRGDGRRQRRGRLGVGRCRGRRGRCGRRRLGPLPDAIGVDEEKSQSEPEPAVQGGREGRCGHGIGALGVGVGRVHFRQDPVQCLVVRALFLGAAECLHDVVAQARHNVPAYVGRLVFQVAVDGGEIALHLLGQTGMQGHRFLSSFGLADLS